MIDWKQVWLVWSKEAREVFRDRRTLMVMFLLPALLYPGLLLVTAEMGQAQQQRLSTLVQPVGIAPSLGQDVHLQKALKGASLQATISSKLDPKTMKLWVGPLTAKNGETAAYGISFDNGDGQARHAVAALRDELEKCGSELRLAALEKAGLGTGVLQPLRVVEYGIGGKEKDTRFLAGRALPALMLLMLVVGCGLMAQDCAAGERERGTLETLLCSPAGRLEIVTGKFLMVASMGVMSGLANLASMTLTMSQLKVSAVASGQTEAINFSLPWEAIPGLLLATACTAALVAAAALLLASFARSVTEAGHMLLPLTLAACLPALASSMPGIALEGATVTLPFINFCLLVQQLLLGDATLSQVLAVCGATLCWTSVLLVLLAKLWSGETLLAPPEAKIFSFKGWARRPWRDRLALDEALLLVFLAGIVNFQLGMPLQAADPVGGLAVSQWGFLGLGTLLYLRLHRVRLAPALSLVSPKWSLFLVCLLIAPSMQVLGSGVTELLFGKSGGGETEKMILEVMKKAEEQIGLIGCVCLFAVTPAVCEEVLFRGALLSAMKGRMGTGAIIFVQGLLFGLMHMSIVRLPGTFLAGCVLAWLALRSRSIFPGIFLHAVFNSLAVLVTLAPPPGLLSFLEAHQGQVLAGALLLFPFGLWLVAKLESSQKPG
ncbi:MAG: hypothetical protein RL095_356 [Verrucomicrobiota bacterium]|jgi:sodium transport system permease protein